MQDTVPSARIGSVGGFVHMVANCAGIVGPTVTGLLVQGTGAFTTAFILAGCIAAVGVSAVVIFVRPISSVGSLDRPTSEAGLTARL